MFLLFGFHDEARNFSTAFPSIVLTALCGGTSSSSLAIAYPLMVAASVLVVLVFSALHEQTFKASQAIGALAIVVGVWVAASGR